MVFLQQNGLPKYTNTEPMTMATSTITVEEEIKHCVKLIENLTAELVFTNWWNIFKIRRIQKRVKYCLDRIIKLKN